MLLDAPLPRVPGCLGASDAREKASRSATLGEVHPHTQVPRAMCMCMQPGTGTAVEVGGGGVESEWPVGWWPLFHTALALALAVTVP